MKVKYATDPQNTKESFMLWSLHDGELVLDTHTWEKTKGFEECINVKATASNFLLIKLLNQRSEGLSKEQLKKLLVLDNKQLEDILHDTTQKKLILYQNGLYRLHFQNPKFNVPPQTSFFNKLVQKSYKGTTHLSSQYSSSEVSNIAKAAFGSSLHIKKSYEICIPIYRISILNPDGSIYNTFWNALNGKEIKTNLLAL